MTAQMRIEAPASDRQRIVRDVLVGLLLAVLLYRAVLFAAAGLAAIRYPWQLDYGEGIVWQQMRWIFTDKAFASIEHFPAIVFHYTPLYHAITSAVSGALATDELATGRAISLLSTLAAGIASAILVDQLLDGRAARTMRRLCACIAALLTFTYLPVTIWAPLMRVDMLAIALGLFGLVAAFKALERPRLIYVASFLFVAAVYAKQTAIAAPAATFAVLIVLRPKLAVRGIAACLVLGTSALLALGWLTDGGFYRHIFLYNVNRPDLGRLSWIAYVAAAQLFYVAAAVYVLARRLGDVRSKKGTKALAALRGNMADARLLIAAAYLLISTLMLALVIKSGSSVNYFLEWFFALGLFAAMAPSESQANRGERPEFRVVLAFAIPAGLALGAAFAPLPPYGQGMQSTQSRELPRLSAMIASADKPVISDDMVLLIRSGHDVQWEPAIFAELASTGAWDERPFSQRIRHGEFAFFVTLDRGGYSFSRRYSPTVADALNTAYPVKEEMAGLVIHLPRQRP